MDYRFQLIVVFATDNIVTGGIDIETKTERTVSLDAALRAAAIYWEDPSCDRITIYDCKAKKTVMYYEPAFA